MNPKNFQPKVKLLYPEKVKNARKRRGFACLATPDPTLPASLHDYWNSIVGSGLLDRLTPQSAGVKDLRRRIKELVNTDKAEAKGKVKNNGNTNTVENPPNLLGMKQVVGAGFSTPFPEGIPLRGLFIFNCKNGGRP
jgi:hypothetical protein